jgi:hypothetical protein
MRRFLLVAMLVFGVVWVAQYRKSRTRVARERAAASAWSTSDEPLPPRSHNQPSERKTTSLRFASTHGEVQITTRADGGTTVLVQDCDEPQVNTNSGQPASTPESASPPTVVESELKYTSDRALADLDMRVSDRVKDWLAEADVPREWNAPVTLTKGLSVAKPEVRTEEKDYGTMYIASVPVELTRAKKEQFLQEYHRHVSGQRLGVLGGGLAFVLACLGIGVGYVRTDEATKGYYTNRLRLLAAVGVGAAGVLLYQWVSTSL